MSTLLDINQNTLSSLSVEHREWRSETLRLGLCIITYAKITNTYHRPVTMHWYWA